MWAKGAVAAEVAAAEVSLARRVRFQSRCTVYRWILSSLAARSCACRLQLLLAISLSLQLLQSTDHRIPITLFCFATKSLDSTLHGTPIRDAVVARQSETQPSSAAASKALATAAASALSTGVSTPLIPVNSYAEARTLPPAGRSPWHDLNYADEGDMYVEEEWLPESEQWMSEAVDEFAHALNSLLGSAKQDLRSPKPKVQGRSATHGNQDPFFKMGWSLHDAESVNWDDGGATAMPNSDSLAERPAWLLPEPRSSLVTSRFVAPSERGTCPAVGGFGHPIGRDFDELEDWDELLCRSGGVLRKTNSPHLVYDTLVLVKGFRGADASTGGSVTAPGDDLSNDADNNGADSIPANGKKNRKLFFGVLDKYRHRRNKPGISEAKHKGNPQSTESSSKNSRALRRKTEAELEDELGEVVDLLSMLHCHLANVVDLRHPSNFQLYAHIRQVALRRSAVLQERKKARLQSSTQQHRPVDSLIKGETRQEGRGSLRFQGHRTSKSTDTVPSAQHHRQRVPRATAPRVSRRGFGSLRGSYSPRIQEEKDAKVMPYPAASENYEFQKASTALDEDTPSERDVSEGSLIQEEDPDDGSGPVLVVVRSLSDRERLFFGAREIKEFLFTKLLQTAYEIRAYKEFRQSLFALARRKRSFRVVETTSADAGKKRDFKRSKSYHEGTGSPAMHRGSALKKAAIAAAHQEGDTSAGLLIDGGSASATLTEKSTNKRLKNTTTNRSPLSGSLRRSSGAYDYTRDEAALGGMEDKTAGTRLTVQESTVADGRGQTAQLTWHTSSVQPAADDKEKEPWWAPLGLRFDLYVSFAGVTPDRAMISPTASLLQLVSEPRVYRLVCVYDFNDPHTDVPPVLRANGSVTLPALVLGRRMTTGARSIERLLLSFVEYKPTVPYSLQRYAPRFLVKEPVFSEVLAAATVKSKRMRYTETRVR